MRRDETYGRLDKMMDSYLISVHFCPAFIPHVDLIGASLCNFLALTQGHLQYHILCMHLSPASFLYSTVHSSVKNLAQEVPMHNEVLVM